MKAPPKRKGNVPQWRHLQRRSSKRLNESPSEKEGKSEVNAFTVTFDRASMKVPPKRKGNGFSTGVKLLAPLRLNESPSEKEGKSSPGALSNRPHLLGLNESPSEKEGKYQKRKVRGCARSEPQ